MRFQIWNILVTVTLFAALGANANQPPEVKKALSNGRLMCQNLFHANAHLLIPMMDYYRGEETGAVVDPLLTHSWAIRGHLSKSPIKDHWKVEYFSESQRAQYEIFPKAGKIYDHQGNIFESKYDPVDQFYEDSLFIVDKDFRFFVLPIQERGRYHHSSLSSGDDVIFAGTISVMDGVIHEISANSGHYKPSALQTLRVLSLMKKKGIDLQSIKLHGPTAVELGNSHALNSKEVEALLSRFDSAVP